MREALLLRKRIFGVLGTLGLGVACGGATDSGDRSSAIGGMAGDAGGAGTSGNAGTAGASGSGPWNQGCSPAAEYDRCYSCDELESSHIQCLYSQASGGAPGVEVDAGSTEPERDAASDADPDSDAPDAPLTSPGDKDAADSPAPREFQCPSTVAGFSNIEWASLIEKTKTTCCYHVQERPPNCGQGGGRPFLVDGRARRADLCARKDWKSRKRPDVRGLGVDVRRALAAAWLEDARLEHASVAAFARLTLELLAFGAPAELVVLSQRASLDEVAHARDCFALASAYAGVPIGPGLLELEHAGIASSLVELAVNTVKEGCIGETLASLIASAQLARATDPRVCAVLERIARDEARHAELAWKVVRWAIEQGGDEVVSAVVDTFAEATSIRRFGALQIAPRAVAHWHAHGRLTAVELEDVAWCAIREVVRPCAALLAQNLGDLAA
jgi:hypothetical protein